MQGAGWLARVQVSCGRTGPSGPCAHPVPSDPLTALADTLDAFAAGLGALLTGNLQPAPGSPAATEAEQETCAGQWGAHPSADALSAVMMLTWSATDHLAATAVLIRAKKIVAPHTLIRSANEACAWACYLSAGDISPLDRVCRVMNYRLDGLSQELDMMKGFTVAGVAEQLAEKEAAIDVIRAGAGPYGLKFRARKPYSPACVGDAPPRVTRLVDECAAMPGLGMTYHQFLSSVAHGKAHGLTRFMRTRLLRDGAAPGQVLTQPSITSVDLAQNLMIGPVCASTLVERLRDYAGWDTGLLGPLVVEMLTTWGAAAGIPYPVRL